MVRCSRCGMLRLDPSPASAELSRFYPEGYWFDSEQSQLGRLAESYRRLVARDHVGFVSHAYRSAGGNDPMLDVGCGGGLIPGMLRERGIPALGLDYSAAACRIASERHGVPALVGDVLAAPFRLASFQLVSLFHVLEHLPAPAAYLGRVHELLRAEGRLVVQVPNAASWQARLAGPRWNGWDIPRHLHDFRTGDLEALLTRCGFDVLRVKQLSWRDNPAGLATSLAPGLDPMARRIRGQRSGMVHHVAYLGLVMVAAPFAVLEAAFGRGSSVMMEARKR